MALCDPRLPFIIFISIAHVFLNVKHFFEHSFVLIIPPFGRQFVGGGRIGICNFCSDVVV